MVNRRNKKLDKYIGKPVEITFIDGSTRTGILEYDRPLFSGLLPSRYYSINDGEYTFFRKTHVKKIREV